MVYKRELKKKPPKGGEEQRQSEAVKRMSPEEKRKYSVRKRMERMFEDRRLVPAKPKSKPKSKGVVPKPKRELKPKMPSPRPFPSPEWGKLTPAQKKRIMELLNRRKSKGFKAAKKGGRITKKKGGRVR